MAAGWRFTAGGFGLQLPLERDDSVGTSALSSMEDSADVEVEDDGIALMFLKDGELFDGVVFTTEILRIPEFHER